MSMVEINQTAALSERSGEFMKYPHLERLGTDEVDGIEIGDCWIFPKIDGANASVWVRKDGSIACGSRKRELSLEDDNQGFCRFISEESQIRGFLSEYPDLRLFGEWLVPHTLKIYRKDAWRQFYVFDCWDEVEQRFLSWEEYEGLLDSYAILTIPPLRMVKNPDRDSIFRCLAENTFLVENGAGIGEGVVVKNYSFVNRYGRVTWAKVVDSEFKDSHRKEMGTPVSKGRDFVEESIVEKYATAAFIEKTFAKVRERNGGSFSSKQIPELLGVLYHEFLVEESWNFVKSFNNPTIDFKLLQRFLIAKAKKALPEVFA